MDPLSVSASVVGILAAAGKMAPLLTKLTALADAPSSAVATLNEISEMTAALRRFQDYLNGTISVPAGCEQYVLLEHVAATLIGSVTTYSELEAIIDSVRVDPETGTFDRIRWTDKENDIRDIVQRIQNHRTSLTLMLTILQCKSDQEAQTSMRTLSGLIERVVGSNEDLSARLHRLQACQFLSDAVTQTNATSDCSTTRPAKGSWTTQNHNALPYNVRLSFEKTLQKSRVYLRSWFGHSESSLTSSSRRTAASSMFSSLSLADLSNLSAISLPIYSVDIYNTVWYTWENPRNVAGPVISLTVDEILEAFRKPASDAIQTPTMEELKRLYEMGLMKKRERNFEEAEILFARALDAEEKLMGEGQAIKPDSAYALAQVLELQERWEEAEGVYRKSLEIRGRVLGKKHPDTLSNVYKLGFVLEQQEKYAKAEAAYRKSLEGRRSVLGKEQPSTLWSAHRLGNVLDLQDKLAEAEILDRETLEIRERVLGVDHRDTLHSAYELGYVLERRNKYEEAESLDRKTLEARGRVLGKEHPDTLWSAHELGCVLSNQQKNCEAEAILRETLDSRERVLGGEAEGTLMTAHWLGKALAKQGKYEEAETVFRKTLETRKRVFGVEDKNTRASAHYLRKALTKQGKHKEAKSVYPKKSP